MASPISPEPTTRTTPSPPQSPAKSSVSFFDRWRSPLSTILLVIFMISIGLAVPTVWARNQLLDTERFVRTVAPLGEDEGFQQAVANRVTTAITQEVASSNLVSNANAVVAALVPFVTTAAVESVAQSFVTSPEFPGVWENAARIAHTGFNALLSGGESPLFDTERGQVSITLVPIVDKVVADLNTRGIAVNPPTDDLTLVVFESPTLSDLQSITKRLDELAILLPILALASLAGYFVLSPNHRGALVAAGLGLAIAMLVVLLFLTLLRWLYLDGLSDSVDKDVARTLFDTLTHYLRWGLRILGLAGLIVAGIGYLIFRDNVSFDSNEEARQSFFEHWPIFAKLENAVATNRYAAVAIWLALVAAGLFLLDWTDFGWIIVLLIGGVAGLILILRAKPVPIEFLTPPPAPETPSGPAIRQPVSLSLQQVADLKSQGMLSDQEFDQAKSLILAGG